MVNIASLLTELRRRDVRIWIDGGKLRCDAPAGVLTPVLREQLKACRAELLEFLRNAEALGRQQRAIVPLQRHGRRLPLFAVAGHSGDVFGLRALARCLGQEQPFYGLQPPGADGQGQPLARVEDMAAYFAAAIRAFRPEGPYLLAGYCAGGSVAFELAQQLRRAGAAIGFLALIASPHPHELQGFAKARRYLREQWLRVRKHAPALLLPLPEQRRRLAEVLSQRRADLAGETRRLEDPLMAQRARVERATLAALARYRPIPYPGLVHLFLPGPEWTRSGGLAARWPEWAAQAEVHYGPPGCTGDNILQEVHGPAFADIFRPCLDSASLAGCAAGPAADIRNWPPGAGKHVEAP